MQRDETLCVVYIGRAGSKRAKLNRLGFRYSAALKEWRFFCRREDLKGRLDTFTKSLSVGRECFAVWGSFLLLEREGQSQYV